LLATALRPTLQVWRPTSIRAHLGHLGMSPSRRNRRCPPSVRFFAQLRTLTSVFRPKMTAQSFPPTVAGVGRLNGGDGRGPAWRSTRTTIQCTSSPLPGSGVLIALGLPLAGKITRDGGRLGTSAIPGGGLAKCKPWSCTSRNCSSTIAWRSSLRDRRRKPRHAASGVRCVRKVVLI